MKRLNTNTKKGGFVKHLIEAPYLLWSALFIIVPLILVAYYAFTDRGGNFTFENVTQLQGYTTIILRSIWFGIIATGICLIIAYPIAYIISQSKAKTQSILIMLIMLPMWMNFLLRTYSLMVLLEQTGIINTLLSKIGLGPYQMINTSGAVILGMVYNFLPYMILPIYSIMTKIDRNVIEAAQDLGGNKFQVLSKVIIPQSIPGIVSGITMVFVPSVSTFYISQKLGGGKFTLIGDVIEMQFKTADNYNLGAAISLVLMVIIIISLAVMNHFADDDEEGGIVI